MAGLHKPTAPCACGSIGRHREWQPERWVCDNCNAILITRASKPQTGVCTKCGAKKSDGVEFVPRHNCCRACKKKYMDAYTKKNYDKLRKQHRASYQRDKPRRQASVRVSEQRTPEAFLRVQFQHKKAPSYKNNPRVDPAAKVIEVDLQYIIDLWYKQDGKCAVLGLPMVHEFCSPYAISIDRIDSSKGYIAGNIQLVTKFVNLGKQKSQNDEILALFDAYFRTRIMSRH